MNDKTTYDVPVLLLAFNRPFETLTVLNALSVIKPKQLFIACDGARAEVPGEIEKCNEVKKLIDTEINWECEVKKLYRLKNLGCGKAVSEAINWFFDNISEGIILEDDTIPNASFFMYAKTMLELYRNDSKIMHIAGSSFAKDRSYKGDYYFSKYPFIWGWATWKRAWDFYEYSISDWVEYKKSKKFNEWCFDEKEQKHWANILDAMVNNEVDTWDYQWLYVVMKKNGLCIVPAFNMISNIGFKADATHTKIYDARFADLPVYNIHINKKYKQTAKTNNKQMDRFVFNNIYTSNSQNNKLMHYLMRTKNIIKKTVGLK